MFRTRARFWSLATSLGVLLGAWPAARAQAQASPAAVTAAAKRAEALWQKGNLPEAIKEAERALTLAQQVYPPNHVETAFALSDLGKMYLADKRLPQAESAYLRSLKIIEAARGRDHVTTGKCVYNLAGVYDAMGDYARAEPLYQRGLQILEARLGPNHPEVATILNKIALLYNDLGQTAKAESLLLRALKLTEQGLGSDSMEVAFILNNLGSFYNGQEQYAKAEALYERSYQIRLKRVGPNHPSLARALIALGNVQFHKENYDQAEVFYSRSVKITEANYGQDHPDIANTLANLGTVYRRKGQPAQAEPFYQRATKIVAERYGPTDEHMRYRLSELAFVYAELGRWTDAVEAADRSLRLGRRYLARVLPALSEAEQLTYLRNAQGEAFALWGSIGLARRDEAQVAARSAGWLLNSKGVIQHALAERTLLARDSTDPRLRDIAEQLRAVRAQLAQLSFTAPSPQEAAQHQQRLQRLTDQEEALVKRLGQAGGHQGQADPWVELDAVRKAIPDKAVLIELARFEVRDFQAKAHKQWWRPPHYVAWIIPALGQGDVRVVDLGEADPIEKAVQAVRQALEATPKVLRQKGEPEAEKELRTPLEALARMVLQPLTQHAGSAEHLILSPDAALWLVPWAALPLADGRYAVEKHPLSYVISGRDLVTAASAGATGRPLVMADPDYDLAPAEARAQAQRLPKSPPPPPEEVPGRTRSLQLSRVARLPGTAAEAQAITPKLHSYAKAEPAVFTDRQAVEGLFKAAQRPQVVVLSTHGFFLPDQQAPRPEALGDAASSRKPLENPLLRCGLLLAGCNQRGPGLQPGDEDGVLTGLEIVGCDLRGTELVVLSACETGLGQVRTGEGVAGLRQAFQLAGARAVVATLWQIPDRETAQLMTRFFTNLADKQGKADALRQAQLALIQARRERTGAAHPFFWAAFTLTSQGL